MVIDKMSTVPPVIYTRLSSPTGILVVPDLLLKEVLRKDCGIESAPS